MQASLEIWEAPAGGRFGEVGGVLVLAEGGLRLDAIDVASAGGEHGFDVAAVFFVIDGGETLPHGAVFNFLRNAFQNDGFVGQLGADRAVHVRRDVFCFAGIRASAEPERVFPPDSPNQHEMRTTAGTSGRDPIIMRFFESLEGPTPGLETFRWSLRHVGKVRPVGTAWSG